MYCRKCGNELSENANFCPKCGQKVPEKFDRKGSGLETDRENKAATEETGEQVQNNTADKTKNEIPKNDFGAIRQKIIIPDEGKSETKKSGGDNKSADKPDSVTSDRSAEKKRIIIIVAIVVAVIIWIIAMIFGIRKIIELSKDKSGKKEEITTEETVSTDDESDYIETKTKNDNDDIDDTDGDDEWLDTGDEEDDITDSSEVDEPDVPEEPTVVTPTPWPDWSLDIYEEELRIDNNVSDYIKCMGGYKKYSDIKGYTYWTVKNNGYEAVNVIQINSGYGIAELRNSSTTRTYYGGGIYFVEESDDYGNSDTYYFSDGKLFECCVAGIWHVYGDEDWDEYNSRAELFIRERGDALSRLNI